MTRRRVKKKAARPQERRGSAKRYQGARVQPVENPCPARTSHGTTCDLQTGHEGNHQGRSRSGYKTVWPSAVQLTFTDHTTATFGA